MKEGLKQLSAYEVAAMRMFSGGVVLLPFAIGSFKRMQRKDLGLLVVSGLLGSLDKPILLNETSYSWVVAIVVGGIIGSYIGSHRFKYKTVQYVLAAVLTVACVKLIFS